MDIDDTGINETATRLLGLEGVSVTQVKDDGSGGSTVYVVTSDDSARACPFCDAPALTRSMFSTNWRGNTS